MCRLLRDFFIVHQIIIIHIPWVSIWRIKPRLVRLGSFLDLYIFTIVDGSTSEHGKKYYSCPRALKSSRKLGGVTIEVARKFGYVRSSPLNEVFDLAV